MTDAFQHLGVYSDWVAAAQAQLPPRPAFDPGPATRQRIRELLGFSRGPAQPLDVRVEPHKFDLPMQESAFAWLGARLRA